MNYNSDTLRNIQTKEFNKMGKYAMQEYTSIAFRCVRCCAHYPSVYDDIRQMINCAAYLQPEFLELNVKIGGQEVCLWHCSFGSKFDLYSFLIQKDFVAINNVSEALLCDHCIESALRQSKAILAFENGFDGYGKMFKSMEQVRSAKAQLKEDWMKSDKKKEFEEAISKNLIFLMKQCADYHEKMKRETQE